jgi:hypothetical protein
LCSISYYKSGAKEASGSGRNYLIAINRYFYAVEPALKT